MKQKTTELPFKVKINTMEYEYYWIHIHYNMYREKFLSEEKFNEIKSKCLSSKAWETEYKSLEGEESVRYFSQAFDELFELLKCGAVTQEEFEEQYKRTKLKL